jgi:MFS transporter, FSR family, fosmidomycin resistance protein
MSHVSSRLSLIFSCLGHAYMHMFTAFYFVIVLALEKDWKLPYHQLIELWTLGALLVGVAALPAGWLGDRWSASKMMVVYFLGMGASAIVCGFLDQPAALLVGLSALGLFAAIYHPVGIAWLVRNAESQGKALGINGVFGAIGVAIAGLTTGALIDLVSWRAAFIVPGAICFATGLALLICIKTGQVVEGVAVKRDEAPAGRSEMVRGFAVLMMTMFCVGMIFQSTQAALPKVFALRLPGLPADGVFGIGATIAAVYTVGGIMQILGGHLADRLPLKELYLSAFIFQIPVLLAIAHFSGLPLVMAAAFTVLFSTGALPAENMMVARFSPDSHRSLAYGLKFVVAFGSAPLAIQFVAFMKSRSGDFSTLFMSLAAIAVMALTAGLMLPGESRERARP